MGIKARAEGTVKSIVQESATVYYVHIESKMFCPKQWLLDDKAVRNIRIGDKITIDVTFGEDK